MKYGAEKSFLKSGVQLIHVTSDNFYVVREINRIIQVKNKERL